MKKILFVVVAAVAVVFAFNSCGNGSKKVETSETTENVEVVEIVDTIVSEVVETTDTVAVKVEEIVE